MSGAYSNQYKFVEQQKTLEETSHRHEERTDVIARSRKLSAQTARRRKALAVKRKSSAQREEKRRQEILNKRREEIRDATERFQRGNTNYGKPNDPKLVKSSTPTLEEALAMVRGGPFRSSQSGHLTRSQSATTYNRANRAGVIHYHGNHGAAYTVDNSEFTANGYNNGFVPAQTNGYNQPQNQANQPQINNTQNNGYNTQNNGYNTQNNGYNTQNNSYNTQNNGYINSYVTDGYTNGHLQSDPIPPPTTRPSRITSAGSVRSNSSTGSKQRAASTNQNRADTERATQQLQTRSQRSATSSRSLFERQLQQHQELLAAEQQSSLLTFTAAVQQEVDRGVQQEMDRDPHLQGTEEEPPARVGSPDSVDSLEAQASPPRSPAVRVVTREMVDSIHAENNNIPTENNGSTQQRSSLASSGFMLHHNRSSQSPVAVVTPQVVHRDTDDPSKGVTNGDAAQNQQFKGQHVQQHPGQQQVQYHQGKGPYAQNTKVYNQSNYSNGQQVNSAEKPQQVEDMTNKVQPSTVYNVIKTNTNGRYNGHYYQDSVVNYVNDMETQPKGPLDDQVAGYDGKNPVVIPSANIHNMKAWETPPPQDKEFSYNSVAANNNGKRIAPEATPTFPTTQQQSKGNHNGTFTVVHSMPKAANNQPPGARPVSAVTVARQQEAPSQARPQVAMEMLKAAANQPLFRVAEPDGEDKLSVQSDVSTVKSEASTLVSDVAEESQPEPEEPKSILRKVSSYGGPLPPNPRPMTANSMHLGGSHIVTRVKSANAALKDSLEVTKHRRDEQTPVKRKKSVRFSDLTYNDEDTTSRPEKSAAAAVGLAPSSLGNSVPKATQKPPRPASARSATVTKATASPSKIPRVASAGTVRRGPFLRPHPPSNPPAHQPHPPAHPPTGRAAINRSNPAPSNPAPSNPAPINHAPSNQEENKYAVYDANGVRLDRTPTDDEINFLWEKVRTCLNRQSTTSSVADDNQNNVRSSTVNGPAMSQKYIDGNNLAPQFRIATRLSNTYTNNYMGTTAVGNNNNASKKKVTMDTLNSYTRRASLLNQRSKQVPPTTLSSTGPYRATSQTITSYHDTEPSREGPTQDVSESMAAFLTAENLAVQSASESEIECAMENARANQQAINNMQPSQKVPTALSIEEQRLMQSLERLNERLHLNETNMYPSANYVPNPPPQKPSQPRENKPPQYGGGFKGRVPLSTSKRQATSNGTVPRHYYRGMSATVAPSGGYTAAYRYR